MSAALMRAPSGENIQPCSRVCLLFMPFRGWSRTNYDSLGEPGAAAYLSIRGGKGLAWTR